MASDLHCSLGAARSFVDPVTNWAVISGVNLNRDLGGMLQAGKYPQQYFGDFVHELTHHWCFHSPVGLALALLQMRARRRALLIAAEQPEGETDAYSVAEDLVRYESAIAIMRPFAEGLALFGEFDALPGDGRVISVPMSLAAISFSTLEDSQEKTLHARWNSVVGRLLLRQRLSSRFIDRKTAVLERPLTAERGGYLAGYLTIKNIWDHLKRRSEKLWDSDLFFGYMKTFFYDDYAFVATLLDPETQIMSTGAGPRDSAANIALYFQQRLAELVRITSDETVRNFEDYVLSLDASKGWPEPWYVGDAPARSTLGRQLLEDRMAELHTADDIGPIDQQIRHRDLWSLAQRDLFCIGSFKAPVRVNEHGRVSVGIYGAGPDPQWPVFNLQGLDGVGEGNGEGSLEYFVSPSYRYNVIAVTRQKQLVALDSMSPKVTPEFKQQLREYQTSLEESLAERELLNSVRDGVLEKSSASVYREHYATNAAEIAEFQFVDKALAHTEEADVPRAHEVLRHRGLLDAFDGRRDHLRAFAKLTLASAMSTDREFIEFAMKDDEYTLDAILAIVRACEQRHPIKLVIEYSAPGGPTFVESLM